MEDIEEEDIDETYEPKRDELDFKLEDKLFESIPHTEATIVSPVSSGWYIQNMYPSLFSKNKTRSKGCGKGTFQGSYGYPINKCLNYYGENSDDFLKSQIYECNSTHLKKSRYSDTSCSNLMYYNVSKIRCTQQCSSSTGYPSYSGSYRLQVGQVSDSDCSGDKTFYYIEMQDVCQYSSYNKSYKISYPNEYDYDNYNCNGYGISAMATTKKSIYVPNGNLTYGCLERPYDLALANAFPTTKYVSYLYPGSVISNSSGAAPSRPVSVNSNYPGNLTYGEIIGWSIAISICFTLCCCLCIVYCCMTYCPWCCACLMPTEQKEKKVIFHGTVHYRQAADKHVEKPYDPNVVEPSQHITERYIIRNNNTVTEEGEYYEEEEEVRPTDTTGMNLINAFAHEDDPGYGNNNTSYYDNRGYDERGYDSRRSNYSITEDYVYERQPPPRYYSSNHYSQYAMSEYSEDYSPQAHYGNEHYDVYV